MEQKLNLKGGVIIIGSLLWQDHLKIEDNDHIRRLWRENRLSDKKIVVKLPIRYGRYSSSNIYTMVFSTHCERYNKSGLGIVVPLKSQIKKIDQLMSEAREISKAEGMCGKFENKWGKVTILFNPDKINVKIREQILHEWKKQSGITKKSWKEYKLGREKPSVNARSELNIKWPSPLDIREAKTLSQLDFLIATATKPKHKTKTTYPSDSEIAETVKNDKSRFYFINNIKHGITTFQDNAIWNKM